MHEQQSYWTRRRLGRRAVLRGAFAGAAGLAGAALIGCGGDEEGPSGRAPGGTTTPASTPSGAAVPNRGGTLRFGYHQDPGYLSPRNSRSGYDNAFLLASGDNYIYVKADGTILPEWSLFPEFEWADETTFRATVRDGVKFHDGTELDSEAVKAHLEFLLDEEKAPTFGYRSLLETVASIETPDARTVQIGLTEPNAGFIAGLAVAPGIPFSIAQVEQLGDDEILNPAMTGPYKVDSYTSGSGWKYVKNEEFWGSADETPFLDILEYRAIAEDETRAAALEAGDLDAIWFPGSNETTLRLSENADIQGRSFQAGPTLLALNQNMPPLDNLKVRQALAHAVDKERVLATSYQEQGGIAKSLLPEGTYGYIEHDPYPYDPERAKQLLEGSGVSTPVKLTFGLPGTPPSAGASLLASLYQEMLNSAGFEVEIQNVENAFDAMYRDKSIHLEAFSTGVRPDPVAEYELYATSYAFYNAGGDTDDPEQARLDELVSQARTEFDDKQREEILHEISRVLLDNVFAQIPIVARIRWVFARQNVVGIEHPEFLNTPAGASFRARLLQVRQA